MADSGEDFTSPWVGFINDVLPGEVISPDNIAARAEVVEQVLNENERKKLYDAFIERATKYAGHVTSDEENLNITRQAMLVYFYHETCRSPNSAAYADEVRRNIRTDVETLNKLFDFFEKYADEVRSWYT